MIINALARHRWGRLLLIPIVIGCGAFSWFSYLDGTKNVQDAGRVKGWWGWLSPAMDEHWARLADPKSADYGSAYHSLKNCGAEWSRSDPQRSYKALSFIVAIALLLTIPAAVLAWVLL
jgi:hypothetical protein